MINEFPAGSDFPESPGLRKKSLLSRLFSTQTLVLTTTVLVILHSVLLLFVGLERFTKRGPEGTEVGLGTFRFEAAADGSTVAATVEFDLHVSLLEKCDRLGRHLLRNHENRVQQGIEELLREATDEDFQDPTFADLKRQFQETINGTLGERVIAEVIMTQVTIERDAPQLTRKTEQGHAAGLGDQTETVWAPIQSDAPGTASTDPNPPGDTVSLPNVD